MSETHDPRTGPFDGAGGRHIPEAEWERLSMFLDGDLPDDDARQLERDLELDPALKAALTDLQQVSVVLRTVERAPAGFAERVLAAVENEPLPVNGYWPLPVNGYWPLTVNGYWPLAANRGFPLGRWMGGAALVAAAAVVLLLALPGDGGDETEAAAAKIDLQAIVERVPDEPPPVAPVEPPKGEIAAAKGAAKPVGPGTAPRTAPQPAPVATPGGTADPLPAPAPAPVEVALPSKPAPYGVARALQYQVGQMSRRELANLAAKFGGGLQDAAGGAMSMDALAADTSGVVYLSIPTDRMPEFDAQMRKLGKRTAGAPDAELQRGGQPLRVEIVVENLR